MESLKTKLVSPYRNIKQYTRITVEPYHMNSDIKNNMKIILKNKVEKKCNKFGYVDEVYRILEYSDGIMPPENLGGSARYDIAYHCKICVPVENTVLIGEVKVINQEVVVAINGPIMFFLPKEHVDINTWEIPEGYLNKQNNKKLLVGDMIKIQIINKRINMNDNNIKAIGKLLDYANEDDVEKYFGSKIPVNVAINNKNEVTDASGESNFII
jgi:DNA-directed RNA polymerase subunit E'/Rpb7